MTHWASRSAFLATTVIVLAAPAQAQVGRKISFQNDVLPIFQKHCQLCHGAETRGGLKLDTLENLNNGGMKGQEIVSGNPSASRLIQLVESRQMPPQGKKLDNIEIATLRGWIQQGAKDDSSGPAQAAEKPLALLEPKDGSTVREKVRIAVPLNSIPPQGFAGIYIDKKFKAALSPPSADEVAEKKLKADAPLQYVWDTQSALVKDSTAVAEDRFPQDGPHVIEVRTYNSDGNQTEAVQAQVNLKNGLEYVSNKPAKLWYGAGTEQVGKQWHLEHTVDLLATSASGGGAFGQAAASAGGPDKITHLEVSRYLVELQDIVPATGTGFWRERRESPLTVTVNNVKQIVNIDSSSRYFPMERTGIVDRSKLMEREKREPIINPIDLPGRPQRMNETFSTNLRINLGAYIPGVLKIDRLQATLEGIEWRAGEPCVRIRLTYLAGNADLDINSVNIKDAKFQTERGTSTIWFSEATNRVIRAEHDVDGTLVVDVSQLGGGGASASGGPGGELGPGMSAGYPGASPYGGTSSGSPYGGAPAGFGSPFGATSSGGSRPGFGAPFAGSPGGYGSTSSGSPYGGSPYGGSPYGGSPYGSSSAGSPYGGSPYGSSSSGGYPGAGGSNTGIPPPTTKKYHVKLKVTTRLLPETDATADTSDKDKS